MAEYVRRSFTSRLLILVAVVVVLFLIVSSCVFGSQLYSGGRVYAGADQLNLARAVSYHMAVGWGILFGIMLGMGAAAQPLQDGRTAFLLAKPVRRFHVLFGQLLGAFVTAVVTVAVLGVVATVFYLIRGHAFPGTLWLALGVAAFALALAAALAAFFATFLPRVVAGMLGIIIYLASWPAAFAQLRDFMTGGYKEAGFPLPWWVRWGSEVYFAAAPPLAGVQLRATDLLAGKGWALDGWLTLATAAAYVLVLVVGTWALFARRDV